MDKKFNLTIRSLTPAANTKTELTLRRSAFSARTTVAILMAVITVMLSACGASSSSTTPTVIPPAAVVPQKTQAPTSAPIPTATSTPQSVAAPTQAAVPTVPQAAVVATQLDPCQLLDTQEASKLAGTTFSAGTEDSTPGGLRMCHYGSNTTNVFTVAVAQAPDIATAQAYKTSFLADLQAQAQQLTGQGLNVTQLPDFADGAVMANASASLGGTTLSGSAIAFLKGTVFFGFSDLVAGGPAPTSDALQTEATTVLGKLP